MLLVTHPFQHLPRYHSFKMSKKMRGLGIPVGETILLTLYYAEDQLVLAQHIENIEYIK